MRRFSLSHSFIAFSLSLSLSLSLTHSLRFSPWSFSLWTFDAQLLVTCVIKGALSCRLIYCFFLHESFFPLLTQLNLFLLVSICLVSLVVLSSIPFEFLPATNQIPFCVLSFLSLFLFLPSALHLSCFFSFLSLSLFLSLSSSSSSWPLFYASESHQSLHTPETKPLATFVRRSLHSLFFTSPFLCH